MSTKTSYIADQVNTRDQAQDVIAQLLARFASDTAFDRVTEDARFAKQTTGEIVNRTAGNLLTSFVTRKPGGYLVPTW